METPRFAAVLHIGQLFKTAIVVVTQRQLFGRTLKQDVNDMLAEGSKLAGCVHRLQHRSDARRQICLAAVQVVDWRAASY